MSKKKSTKKATTTKKVTPDSIPEKKVMPEKNSADKELLSKNTPSITKEATVTSASKEPSANKKPSASSKEQSAEKPSANTNSSPIGTQTVQPKSKKSGSGLSIFAILISLTALGATGYSWYMTQIKNVNSNTDLAVGIAQIEGHVTRMSDSVSRLQSDQTKVVTQAQLTNQLLKANTSVDKQVRGLKQTQDQLSESLTKINENLEKGANQYIIDEVSQLLKLGNNSAIFSGDAEAAIKAFTLADIQLKELANPRFSVVRRKINEEILLLKSIKQIDAESMLAKITSISNNISQLPLENEPPVVASEDEIADDQSSENATWRSEFNRMWSDILNSVTIQKVDQPPKPLLAPKERYFLNQNIELQLVKAEIALLQNRQSVFNNSIDEALTWLNDYFDLDNKAVQNTLKELKEIQSATLKSDLPSIAGSYDLLQSIKGGQ